MRTSVPDLDPRICAAFEEACLAIFKTRGAGLSVSRLASLKYHSGAECSRLSASKYVLRPEIRFNIAAAAD